VNEEQCKLVDLQGNVIADLSEYHSMIVLRNNLIRVENEDNQYGLLDSDGKLLIECKYDRLDCESTIIPETGYVYAEKDGMCGFVSLKDGSETGFGYPADACDRYSLFLTTRDEDGSFVLISAAAGALAGSYQDVSVSYDKAVPFATVQEKDGQIHVIDMNGNDVLPDNPVIKDTYAVQYSSDGSLILVRDENNLWHIYSVSERD
jgi:hypothetical protein